MRPRDLYKTRPRESMARIREVEHRIGARKNTVRLSLGQVAGTVRNKLITPVSLLAAVLVGAAMGRTHQLNSLRLLAVLQAANAGLRFLQAGAEKPVVPGQ